MRLKNIINKLNKEITNERNLNPEGRELSTSISYGIYDVEVEMDWDGNTKVVVINSEYERDYPNIEGYLSENIILWDEIEIEEYDEWDDHGFKNEADFWKYRLS